jgi:hypothetical protein
MPRTREEPLVLGKLGMDKIEPVERMFRVLDAPIHMHAAIFAGVPLDGRIDVHNLKLVTRSLSRGTTATCENSAPAGFQHLVHPHT